MVYWCWLEILGAKKTGCPQPYKFHPMTDCTLRSEGLKDRGRAPEGGKSRDRENENTRSSRMILSRVHPGSLT